MPETRIRKPSARKLSLAPKPLPVPLSRPRSKQACTNCKRAKTRCLAGEGRGCVRCARRGESHLCTPAIPQRIGRKRIHTSTVPISSEELKKAGAANEAKRARRLKRIRKTARRPRIKKAHTYPPADPDESPSPPSFRQPDVVPQRTRSGRLVRSTLAASSQIFRIPVAATRKFSPAAAAHPVAATLKFSPIAATRKFSPVAATRQLPIDSAAPLSPVTSSPSIIPSDTLTDHDFSQFFASLPSSPPVATRSTPTSRDLLLSRFPPTPTEPAPFPAQASGSTQGPTLDPFHFLMLPPAPSPKPGKRELVYRETPACQNILCNPARCSHGKLKSLDDLRFSSGDQFLIADSMFKMPASSQIIPNEMADDFFLGI